MTSVLNLLRPRNAIPPMLALSIGYAAWGGPLDIGVLAPALALVLLAHSFATLQNDIEDQPVDRANNRASVLLSGGISTETARQLYYLLLAATFIAAALSPNPLLHGMFAAFFVSLAWVYNRRPLLLSRRPLASIAVLGLFYGAVPLAYGLSLTPATPPAYLLSLVPAWFLVRSSLSILKDYKDHIGDAQHHKRTFLLRYGPVATRRASIVLAITGYTLAAIALAPELTNNTSRIIMATGLLLGAVYTVYLRTILPTKVAAYPRANLQFHQLLAFTNLIDLGILSCLLYL